MLAQLMIFSESVLFYETILILYLIHFSADAESLVFKNVLAQ